MGTACLIPICSLETGCAVASSTVAIAYKAYEFKQTRKRQVKYKVLLPPIKKSFADNRPKLP